MCVLYGVQGGRAPAAEAQPLHARKRQLPQVASLHSTRDQRHGDVSLDAVDPHPGWHQREHARHEVDQPLGRVAAVRAGLPELVEAGAADDERGVDFQAVRPAK